jgi:hypothetical protein
MPLVITIASTGEHMQFDPIKESWNHPSVATMNPVEKGSNITDHVQPKPLTYSCELRLIDAVGELPPSRAEGVIGQNRLLVGLEAELAQAFFRRCQGLEDGFPKVLTLVTGFGLLDSMVLLDWPQSRDFWKSLPTSLSFQQIRTASSLRVILPRKIAGLPSGGKDTSDLGTQGAANESIIWDAMNAITGPGDRSNVPEYISSITSYFGAP